MGEVIVENVSKSYRKDAYALRDVTFSVNAGELFGLIGPDGAGKTSLFRILTTLLLPDEGNARVNGLDVVGDYRDIRSQVGYMPGRFSLYQDLTVHENLQFFASVFNTTIEENYNLIKTIYVQIEPFRNRKAGKLSGGMKQKLALCCALIHKPKVLFLDEPTTGVDAVSRKELWDMLQELKSEGITIMVSTPYMDEATLCERIALIQNGRILSIDTPENIISEYPWPLYAVKSDDMSGLLKDLRTQKELLDCNAFGEYHHITFDRDSETEKNIVLMRLKDRGHRNIVMSQVKPTIEDCFIQLMRSHE